ncbi:MAG: acetyl-CoA carboxylase carboxyltransferase subunit alpha [Victivallales bacterium]|nr:acetyl-CoA carboxylase carboxyltransferase subunit alpha [Victivallales bacterium]
MPTNLLEFETPLAELDICFDAISEHARKDPGVLDEPVKLLRERIHALKEYFVANMTPWEKVRMARHPMRPQPIDLCRMIFTDFLELHGDRRFRDDRAIVGGFAMLEREPVMVIFTQKGRSLREYTETHFGMAEPEGYRKALRLMHLAEKAGRPVLTLVDTPGAYPGVGGEERHIGEAIACNLRDMFRLTVPVISVITGEGGSGGALALAVGNRVLMLANAYYSAITPEGCAAILWRSPEKTAEAANALKLTAPDLLELGVVDEVVPEPLGGAHRDPAATAQFLRDALLRNLKMLQKRSRSGLKSDRYKRFRKLGVWEER